MGVRVKIRDIKTGVHDLEVTAEVTSGKLSGFSGVFTCLPCFQTEPVKSG